MHSMKQKTIKLNLGCGNSRLRDYINIDVAKTPAAEVIADCANLPYEPGTVDEIANYHLIEHFDQLEAIKLLKYWKSLLKPGGKLVIECPNILGMVKRFMQAYEETGNLKPGYLFSCHDKTGRENIANDNHKWGYTKESLKKTLEEVGFVSVIASEGTDYHAKGFKYEPGYFIRIEATNPNI